MYIWELPDWPNFRWDDRLLLTPLAAARFKQGQLLGRMERLGFDLGLKAQLQALTEEVLKNSEIEGDFLDRKSIRSSIARRLGMPQAVITDPDRRIDAVVEMSLDATRGYAVPLTADRLFRWQAALFPTGYSGLQRIKIAGWREGPIQVLSGPVGRERIHFEGPPAERVDEEMARFLEWFNGGPQIEGLIRAAVAHLWFITIHPFEDGNGRIARAIADMALAQTEGSSQRFYSISSQIRRERDEYYRLLEQSQKGNLDITAKLVWFLECFTRAVDGAELLSADVLRKADFWQRYAGESLTDRQKMVLNRFLDGFEGKLTARKWAALGKCSIASAQRDIGDLLERGILKRNQGGSKNTSYEVAQ